MDGAQIHLLCDVGDLVSKMEKPAACAESDSMVLALRSPLSTTMIS